MPSIKGILSDLRSDVVATEKVTGDPCFRSYGASWEQVEPLFVTTAQAGNETKESKEVFRVKLAEALLERKRVKEEIMALRERAQRDSRVQEGDRPAEDPEELMGKIVELVDRLRRLTIAVNRTNMAVKLPDGRTLMEAVVERDMLKLLHEATKEVADTAAGAREWRVTRSEIKFVPTVDIAAWRRRADEYAKRYRELDAAIQAANWSNDLLEEI